MSPDHKATVLAPRDKGVDCCCRISLCFKERNASAFKVLL